MEFARYFAPFWDGEPFQLFGPRHLLALALCIAATAALLIAGKRANPTQRRWLRGGLVLILFVAETSFHWWYFVNGWWSVQLMLPLQLCSVLVWLSQIMLITRSYRLFEFAYLLGVAGATQALLTPDAGPYGLPHYRAVQTFVSHTAIIAAALWMLVVEGYRPNRASPLRAIVGINLLMIAAGTANWLLGSNYMFLARPLPTPSLIDLLGPWPWYILALEAIGITLIFLLYLPFARNAAPGDSLPNRQ